MNKKFFSGDSVQQALLQAARYFQVEPDDVVYREVDRRHGFLRGRRRAVIEVDIDSPVRVGGSQAAAPEPEAAPAAPEPEAAPVAREPEATPRAREPEATPTAREPEATPTAREPEAEPAVREPKAAPAGEEGESVDSPMATEPPPAAQPEEKRPFFGPRRTEPVPLATDPSEGSAAAPRSPEPPPAAVEKDPVPSEEPAEPASPATEAAEAAEATEATEATAPATEAAAGSTDDLADAARQALSRLFELGHLDLEVEEVRQGGERLEVELRGADEEILLEDRGRLLLAIQHLLPRMLRGLTGRSAPCQVDCDDFHEIRTEQLRDLAQRVASEVRNARRSRTLEPMSPDERRIVHLTLADDPAVETVSQGNGLFKRVQIRPQKMQPRGFDPFSRD